MIRSLVFIIAFFINLLGNSQTIDVIEFVGLDKIKESYLIKTLLTDIGASADSSILNQEMRFLRRMPGINKANYKIIRDGNQYKLIYEIEESFTILPDVDLRIADDLLTYRIGFQEFNLFGRGIQLKAAFQNNGKSSYFIQTDVPYLMGNFGLSATYKNIKSDEPFYLDNNTRLLYELYLRNTELAINWQLNYSSRASLGFGHIGESFSSVESQITDDLDLPNFLDYNKYSIKANYSLDLRDWDYYKTNGLYTYLQFLKVFDQDNPVEFNEVRANLNYYKTVNQHGNLALRFIAGYSTNSDSPLAPFVLDSHLNIRGVGDRMYRGTGVFVLNAEYRRTIFDRKNFASQVVVFTDLGATRMPGENFMKIFNNEFSRFHTGGGLRFIYKKAFNSVFRIDYGYGIDAEHYQGLVFGLGQYF